MDKTTKKALKKSIKLWSDEIVKRFRAKDSVYCMYNILYWKSDNSRVKYHSLDCPLCKLFYDKDCSGCPVLESLNGCNKRNSLWMKFYLNPCLKTASAMLSLLKKILESA
jgi:hypothetical protein